MWFLIKRIRLPVWGWLTHFVNICRENFNSSSFQRAFPLILLFRKESPWSKKRPGRIFKSQSRKNANPPVIKLVQVILGIYNSMEFETNRTFEDWQNNMRSLILWRLNFKASCPSIGRIVSNSSKVGSNLNDIKALTHPFNSIILTCFFISENSWTRRFLCQRFRPTNLWNVFLSVWVHSFIKLYGECQKVPIGLWISAYNLSNFWPQSYLEKSIQISCWASVGTNSKYSLQNSWMTPWIALTSPKNTQKIILQRFRATPKDSWKKERLKQDPWEVESVSRTLAENGMQPNFCMATCQLNCLHMQECWTSLLVQWLRLHAPIAGGPGSIPGQVTRFHMPQWTNNLYAPSSKAKPSSQDTKWDKQNSYHWKRKGW